MKKIFTLLSGLSLFCLGASASIPNGLRVTPDNNATVNKIDKIQIEYHLGWYTEIGSYRYPDIQINGVPVNVTYSVSSDDVLTYTLETPITRSGVYEIFIAAGSFYYDEIYEYDNPDMSWKVTVQGDDPEPGGFEPIVNSHMDIVPEQGTYSSLQYFTVVINGAFVEANSFVTCYLMKDDDTETIVATGKASEGAGLIYGNVDLTEEVTTPGTYILVVPEGAFYDLMTDEDFSEGRFRYVIAEDGASSLPAPDNVVFTPSSSEILPSLSRVLIEYPDMSGVYENVNSSTKLGDITVTDGEGIVVANGEVDKMGIGENLAGNQAIININPVINSEGYYTLNIPARTFVIEGAAMYDGAYSTAQKITYHVDPGVGVDEISVASDKEVEIYRIDGTRVEGSRETLPAGFYIINGKKVMVK